MTEILVRPAVLTRGEVAKILKTKESALLAMADNGEIPAPMRIGGARRWHAGEFFAWLHSR